MIDIILKEKSVGMKVALERSVWKIGDNDNELGTGFGGGKEIWKYSNIFDNLLTTSREIY